MRPDYSIPAYNCLVFGGGSTGKTTLCYRVILNTPAAAVFIFDEDGQAAHRLKIKPCGTARECELALAGRIVCFNPYIMWPAEKLLDAFRWFCHWAYQASQRGPGAKIFYVDEQWKVSNARNLPAELERIVRTGRFFGMKYLSSTHRPRDYHINIRALVTEWICFNMVEPDELDAVRPYYRGVDKVATLPKFHFISYDRVAGTELAGRLS